MASACGFDIAPGGQGAIFALSGSGRRDRSPLANVIGAAHGVAQELLDIVAVEERSALLSLAKSSA